MKNIVILFKTEDGDIYCKEITKKGIEYANNMDKQEDLGYWEDGGTILLEELEEILDKEI